MFMFDPAVASLVRVTGEYRAALVVMVAAAALLAALAFIWRRCQLAFVLHFRQNKAASLKGTSTFFLFHLYPVTPTRRN